MKAIKEENLNFTEITIFDIIQNDEVKRSEIPLVIQQLSDNFESYEVDSMILNKIIKIILDCGPNKKDLKDIDVEKVKELLNLLL